MNVNVYVSTDWNFLCNCHMNVNVYVYLVFQIRVIDVDKSKKVYEDIMKKLDRVENDYLPQIKLEKTEVMEIQTCSNHQVIVTVINH